MQDLIVDSDKAKDQLLKELETEKKKSGELEQATRELQRDKESLQEQVTLLSEEQVRLNGEIREFSSAKQELSDERMKEMDLLSKALTSAYDHTPPTDTNK